MIFSFHQRKPPKNIRFSPVRSFTCLFVGRWVGRSNYPPVLRPSFRPSIRSNVCTSIELAVGMPPLFLEVQEQCNPNFDSSSSSNGNNNNNKSSSRSGNNTSVGHDRRSILRIACFVKFNQHFIRSLLVAANPQLPPFSHTRLPVRALFCFFFARCDPQATKHNSLPTSLPFSNRNQPRQRRDGSKNRKETLNLSFI